MNAHEIFFTEISKKAVTLDMIIMLIIIITFDIINIIHTHYAYSFIEYNKILILL